MSKHEKERYVAEIELLRGLLKVTTQDETRIYLHQQLELIQDKLELVNQQGFSLVEAVITMAISLIGALAMLSLTMMTLQSERNVASMADFTNLQDRIKMFVSNPILCPKTITSLTTKQVNLSGETITVNTKLASGSTVTDIYLEIISPTPLPGQYSTYLKLSGLKNPVSLGPKILKDIIIPVTITVDASNNITSCILTDVYAKAAPTPIPVPSPTPPPSDTDYAKICVEMGGVWTQQNKNFFYCQLN